MIDHALLALAPLGLMWILTCRKSILPTAEELMEEIQERNSNPEPDDPIKGIVDSDKKWWKDSKGYDGVYDKLRKSVCYVQLCQHLYRKTKMPMAKFAIVARKAFLLPAPVLGCFLEEPVRLIWKKMPHLCARCVAHIYSDLRIEAENLNLQYGTENWINHA